MGVIHNQQTGRVGVVVDDSPPPIAQVQTHPEPTSLLTRARSVVSRLGLVVASQMAWRPHADLLRALTLAVIAALLGTALIDLPEIAPVAAMYEASARTVIAFCLLLVAGGAVGIALSQARRARQEAVALSRLLEIEQARRKSAGALDFDQLVAQMDEFLSIASHEIRTPLTTIGANAQLLERRLRAAHRAAPQHVPAEAAEAACVVVDRIQRQVARLNRLVDDLTSATHVQLCQLDLRPVPCDLVAVVRAAVDDQRQATPERTIRLDVSGEPAAIVRADAARIGQVLANYLSNALKFSAEDCPVTVRLRCKGGMVRVSVHDEGPGLPPEEQERIWERFQRARGIEVWSGSSVGLGLGLYISRAVIERHGGAVGVESTPGQGATFWFTLPLALAPLSVERETERLRAARLPVTRPHGLAPLP